jgi:hypothetical protein
MLITFQGDELQADTEVNFSFTQHHTEGGRMFTTMKIFASSYDVAPQFENDEGKSVSHLGLNRTDVG